ncbi:hypothetical protein P8C59_000861 [Phyllachora maydis]|uniref:Uncharacterized protein n=1 Tax=Phyllachora maydis TaxID=1825666 RepID=A0AAD9M899_9PEZI|nr:hypothetical protein P8C59_000861 [Phyllachora maydis]
MYIYIAYLPYCCYYYDLLFANLLITNIDSLSDLDDLVYTILAPILAKPAKITPAIHYTAAYKAKQYKSAKAYAIAAKKKGLQRSKRTTSSNTSKYTTDSGLIANKDDNNAYNRAYIPPANTEEKKGSNGNNNSVNSSTSNNADKGKGSSTYKYSKGASYYKDTLPYKRHIARITSGLLAAVISPT